MKDILYSLSDEELEQEIERRIKIKEQKERPHQVKNPDWSRLIKTCEEVISERERGESCDSDLPHYIYEEAMQAVFGPNVFEWINKHC